MNAQELAKQAGSSPAAIIRFCHSMDVNGFTELKTFIICKSWPNEAANVY